MSDDPKRPTNGAIQAPSFSYPKADSAKPGEEDAEEPADAASTPLELPAVELGPTPERVKELIAACVRFVTARYGVLLDGTPDTLSLLDQYVRDARAEIGANPASLELVMSSIGAYLGEVLRQTFLGEWFAEGEPDTWRIDMRTVFLTFNPVAMAREALTLEPADGWHAHLRTDEEDREEIEARLGHLGAVDEEEYYAPTTRYDVVELAVTTLRARMLDRGLGDVRFSAEDYRSR